MVPIDEALLRECTPYRLDEPEPGRLIRLRRGFRVLTFLNLLLQGSFWAMNICWTGALVWGAIMFEGRDSLVSVVGVVCGLLALSSTFFCVKCCHELWRWTPPREILVDGRARFVTERASFRPNREIHCGPGTGISLHERSRMHPLRGRFFYLYRRTVVLELLADDSGVRPPLVLLETVEVSSSADPRLDGAGPLAVAIADLLGVEKRFGSPGNWCVIRDKSRL